MRKRKRNLEPENLTRVRALRTSMSASERVLWLFLRGKKTSFLFRRQYPIGPYVLDFYCPEARVCVEVDGEQHFETLDKGRERDAYLEEQGVLTIRVPSLDLFDPRGLAISGWLQVIKCACEERTGRQGFDPY